MSGEQLPRICFTHVPKTAGISLVHALRKIYGPDHSFRAGCPEAYRELQRMSPPEVDERFRLVSGHFYYRFFSKRVTQNWLYISVLRDPVDRLISVYNYISTEEWHPLHPTLGVADPLTFFAEMCRPDAKKNEQCFHFSAQSKAEGAISNVRNFYWMVATLDSLDLLVNQLSKVLNRELVLGRENVSKGGLRRSDLPASTIDDVYSANSEDDRFFRWIAGNPRGVWIHPQAANLHLQSQLETMS